MIYSNTNSDNSLIHDKSLLNEIDMSLNRYIVSLFHLTPCVTVQFYGEPIPLIRPYPGYYGMDDKRSLIASFIQVLYTGPRCSIRGNFKPAFTKNER